MPGCSIGLLFQGWSREVPLRLRLYHMPSRELPPLARGLPSPSCSASAGGGDHPRSRGVYGASSLLQLLIGGSSPLARGLRRCAFMTHVNGRIIPARAGFTPRSNRTPTSNPDHPRSRGVYAIEAGVVPVLRGSSPLARGLPPFRLNPGLDLGIIPARAGFTESPTAYRRGCTDHPRSRGVYSLWQYSVLYAVGSSPLARGLRGGERGGEAGEGIIPARAGFTSSSDAVNSKQQDHPRSRGVYGMTRKIDTSWSGSSPLARGLPFTRWESAFASGIIPARAGFTQGLDAGVITSGDHPRSRGVYLWK